MLQVTPRETTHAIARAFLKAKLQFYRDTMLISGLSVLVLERHPRATSKVFGACFRHCFISETSILVVLPQQKHYFAFDGLIVGQHVFKVFRRKWPFRISGEVWGFGASAWPSLCSLEGRSGKKCSFTGDKRCFLLYQLLFWETAVRDLYTCRLFLSSLCHGWKSCFSWFFPGESNVRGCWVEALNLKVLGLALLR